MEASTNLFLKYIKIESNTTDSWPGTERLAATQIGPSLDGGWNIYPFTATTDAFIRISFPTSSVAPQIGQGYR
jgi:hypothetical protein